MSLKRERIKRQRSTEKIELVETHNIALSLERIKDAPGYDQERWKRALIHALGMARVASNTEQKAIREALGLP